MVRPHYGPIETRCPSCGRRALYLDGRGRVMCSLLDCKQPDVELAVEEIKKRVTELSVTREG